MKRYIDPSKPPPQPEAPPEPLIKDISVSRLLDDGLLALYREMRNLLLLSYKGKLDAPSARDLRDTIKLLFEIQTKESAVLKSMTDEELAEKVKEIVNPTE